MLESKYHQKQMNGNLKLVIVLFAFLFQVAMPESSCVTNNFLLIVQAGETSILGMSQGDRYFCNETLSLLRIRTTKFGYYLQVTFNKFDFQGTNGSCTDTDYVQIGNGEVPIPEETKICGTKAPDVYNSAYSVMHITYSALNSIGFKVTAKSVAHIPLSCDHNIALPAGLTENLYMYEGDPLFRMGQYCVIRINTTVGYHLVMTFSKFEFSAPNGYCTITDNMLIGNGLQLTSNALTLCGLEVPDDFVSSYNAMFFRYHAYDAAKTKGFRATVKSEKSHPDNGCGNKAVYINTATQNVSFPLVGHFSTETKCEVTVTLANDYATTTGSITIMSIAGQTGQCEQGFFQISTSQGQYQDAEKYCGANPVENIISGYGPFYVQITINDTTVNPSFTLQFVSLKSASILCNHKLIVSSWATEHINMYEGDSLFRRRQNCLIQIETSVGYHLKLTFSKFEFQGTNGNCSDTDYLQIGNGLNPQNDTAKMCGIKAPSVYFSSKNTMFIKYIAMDIQITKGFRATVESDFTRYSAAGYTKYSNSVISLLTVYVITVVG